MNKKLLIIGASGHGKVVADIAKKMNQWQEIAFLDDNPDVKETLGFPVIGTTEDIIENIETSEFFVAVGNNEIRKKVQQNIEEANGKIVSLIHPSAIIAEDVQVRAGSVIMAGAVINSGTFIKEGAIINTSAIIDHDCTVGEYAHISPGATIAGTVSIGNRCWMGAGATVINNINIAEDCIVGAGAVVVNDLLTSGTYIGVPARRVSQ